MLKRAVGHLICSGIIIWTKYELNPFKDKRHQNVLKI